MNTIQELMTDFEAWRDKWGLQQENPERKTTGNGIRYTGEYVLAGHLHGGLPEEERQRVINVIRSCEVEPGFIKRTPNANPDWQQGPDDYIAYIAMGKFLKTDFAKMFIHYGENKGAVGLSPKETKKGARELYRLLSLNGRRRIPYVFNNWVPRTFSLSAWLGRQQQLIAHAYFTTGKRPSLSLRLVWIATLLLSARGKPNDPDNWVLSWFLVMTAKGQCSLCDAAARVWARAFRKKVPGGVGQCLADKRFERASAKWLHGQFGI